MHYLHRTPKVEPKVNSPEFFAKIEKEMERDLLRTVEEPEPEWFDVHYTEVHLN